MNAKDVYDVVKGKLKGKSPAELLAEQREYNRELEATLTRETELADEIAKSRRLEETLKKKRAERPTRA
jgi:hypothetical protein